MFKVPSVHQEQNTKYFDQLANIHFNTRKCNEYIYI